MSTRTMRSSKRFIAALAAVGVAASTIAISGGPATADDFETQAQVVTVVRTEGANRYATAANVATTQFGPGARPVENVILASGENFPDGLAASSLAGAANAPVLLTRTASLPIETVNALSTLNATTVHIVGGEAAVSAAARAQLIALGYTLNELSGANRYETAAEISEFVRTSVAPIGSFAGLRTAIIATGENFPDALAAGSPAAAGVHPILLVRSSGLPAATAAELTAANVQQVIVMGGTAAVPAAVADEISALGINVIRVGGSDRFQTAQILASALTTPAPAGFSFSNDGAFLVSGSDFADALAAGPWAGAVSQPVLLAGGAATNAYFESKSSTLATIRVIGGPAAVTPAQAEAAQQAATSTTPTATVSGFAGSTGLKVEFSEAVVNSGTVSTTGAGGNVACPGAGACVLSADGRTLTVTMGAALVAGDVITVGGFTTPAATGSRLVAPAQFTVAAASTAAPTATISAVAGGATYTVVYSRSVSNGDLLAVNELVRAGATTTAASVVVNDAPFNTSFTVTPTGGPLVAGDIVRIVGATPTDGGPSLTTQRTVSTDLVAPTLTNATLVVSGTPGSFNSTPGAVDTNVNVTADRIGPESQGIVVQFVNSAEGAPGVAVPTTAAVTQASSADPVIITVTLGRSAAGAFNATPAMVAAAINGNGTAASLVTAVASVPGSTSVVAPVGPSQLSTGTRIATVTSTFSEAIRQPVVANFTLDLAGNTFQLVAADDITSTPADHAAGVARATFILGLNQNAVVGTSQIRVTGVQDIAGNMITPVARTLVAPA